MRIGFVGGGYMGEAIVAAALKQRVANPDEVTVSDVAAERREQLSQKYGVAVTDDNDAAVGAAGLVVLAVKPQEFPNVADGLRGKLDAGTTVLTIMAGVPVEKVAAGLGHGAVARAMPNTAALVGEAISIWTVSPDVSSDGKAAVAALLSAMGRQLEVADERYLDMATAVSGSGPGFFFLFLEAFIDAAVKVGLPPDVAKELCLQTLFGSAVLARETGKEPAELRAMVTSKGGTTAAGLQVFEEAGLRDTVAGAVRAAYTRAKELA